MIAERWSAFLAYAARALGKPTYEEEERIPRLRVAAELREAVALAAAGGDWQASLRSCLFSAAYPSADLTTVAQNEWLESWLVTGDPRLEAAVAGFGQPDTPPEERFAALALAAAAQSAGNVAAHPNAVLAFGSLLNFAVDLAQLPFVLAKPFRRLQELLGRTPKGQSEPTDTYRDQLAFARTVEARLREARIPVHDMLDVQSLIVDASRNAVFWSEPAADGAVPDVRRPAPRHYLSVCAIYRDEAAYLREWIELHRLVGVERFFLYDNRSTDEHREVLAPYVEEGFVTLHDWPMPQGQLAAYEHCIAEHRAESRWIAFIDLDEFLFSPTGRPLPELLVEYEQWPAVGVNWAVFGPSGHVAKPSSPVIESYVERLNVAANRTIKSIVDPARVAHCAGVHRFTYDRLGTVDENQYPIFGGQTKSVSFQRLRINHYFTKSVEEYRERTKRKRPDPAMVERQFDPAELTRWQEGAVRDEAILQYVPALRRSLAAAQNA
jgi:glycosyl transferase family 92